MPDNFTLQFQRLFLVWRNYGGVKTRTALLKRLGTTDAEYLEATRTGIMPTAWLHTTAEELKVDIAYIRTGKTI